MIRDLIESKVAWRWRIVIYYTGFVNDQGDEIKGMAAKWKMADWLVEKLDEIVEFGYQ